MWPGERGAVMAPKHVRKSKRCWHVACSSGKVQQSNYITADRSQVTTLNKRDLKTYTNHRIFSFQQIVYKTSAQIFIRSSPCQRHDRTQTETTYGESKVLCLFLYLHTLAACFSLYNQVLTCDSCSSLFCAKLGSPLFRCLSSWFI